MKLSRQEKIIQLISEFDIETQEELAGLLNKAGFKVTQATVSRDINELHLEKAPSSSGGSRYIYPENKLKEKEKYLRIFRDGFLSSEQAGNFVVIKTVSGMAMAVAAAFDALDFKENIGSIAGDDTIMCATASDEAALALLDQINKIV